MLEHPRIVHLERQKAVLLARSEQLREAISEDLGPVRSLCRGADVVFNFWHSLSSHSTLIAGVTGLFFAYGLKGERFQHLKNAGRKVLFAWQILQRLKNLYLDSRQK